MAAGGSHGDRVDWLRLRQRLRAAMEVTAGRWEPPEETRQRNLEARMKALARARDAEPASGPAIGAIIFRLSGAPYALQARYVREVVPLGTLVPIPRTPDFVAGLFNLRGRLLPVFDLRLILDPAASVPARQDWAVACGEKQPDFLFVTDLIAGIAAELPEVASPLEPPATAAWIRGRAADGTRIMDGAALMADRRLFLERDKNGGSGTREGTR